MSLSLTFYFHISSCLDRLDACVICGHFWRIAEELWYKPRPSQPHWLRMTLSVGIITQRLHCLQTNVAKTDLKIHMQKAMLPTVLVAQLRPWAPWPLCSFVPQLILFDHTFLSPCQHSGRVSSAPSGLLRAHCSSFPPSGDFRFWFILTIVTTGMLLSSACMHWRMSLLLVYWMKPDSSDALGSLFVPVDESFRWFPCQPWFTTRGLARRAVPPRVFSCLCPACSLTPLYQSSFLTSSWKVFWPLWPQFLHIMLMSHLSRSV